jgi:hypothetical protein
MRVPDLFALATADRVPAPMVVRTADENELDHATILKGEELN